MGAADRICIPVWRPIPGYGGYFVNREGKVASTIRGGLRVLKPWEHRSGHLLVALGAGNPNKKLVHRLVLEAFVGPCPEGMECCHNNGKPADNRIENLRWDTRKANVRDAVKHGVCPFLHIDRVGEANGRAKLTEHDVREIREHAKAGIQYVSMARSYGVTPELVSMVARRKIWRHVE